MESKEVEIQRQTYKKTYSKWTKEDEERLEVLFCEGLSISELTKEFGRNNGAIRSSINKLELKEKYGG